MWKILGLPEAAVPSGRVDALGPGLPHASEAAARAAAMNRRALMGRRSRDQVVRWAGWHPRREDISPQSDGSGNHPAGPQRVGRVDASGTIAAGRLWRGI